MSQAGRDTEVTIGAAQPDHKRFQQSNRHSFQHRSGYGFNATVNLNNNNSSSLASVKASITDGSANGWLTSRLTARLSLPYQLNP